jgi:mannose-6-phosphate isomerase class I
VHLHNFQFSMSNFPFQTIDWTSIEKTEHKGETGIAFWQTIQLDGLRIRLVEYTDGYLADHWCQKGHIVHCLEGEFISEMGTGEQIKLTKGQTYVVSDDQSSHRSSTANGVKLLIVDGDFLKPEQSNTKPGVK